MRVLLITNDYPPRAGGIQYYLAGLVASVPTPVRVLAPFAPEAAPDEQVVRAPWRFMWPTTPVRRWIETGARDFAPDLLLFGAPFPLAALGPALRRRLGIPYAVLVHGAELAVPTAVPGLGRLLAGALRGADLVLANSRYTTRLAERRLQRTAHHLGIGVDTATFRPAPSRERRRPVIGTVSRFVARKRQADVIRAVASLRARGLDAELLVVGCGHLERRLRQLASRHAVPTRFAIDVAWDRLPDLYREMDVFALPCRSRWLGLEAEGLGAVFLEAAASALPVIAGDSGGAPETVASGRSGFIVHQQDELVEALVQLTTDPQQAAQMGAEGRARMQRDFSWDDVGTRLHAAASSAVGRSPAAC